MLYLLLVLSANAYGDVISFEKFSTKEQCELAGQAVLGIKNEHSYMFRATEVKCVELKTVGEK